MRRTAAFLCIVGLSFFLTSCFIFKKSSKEQLPKAPEKVERENKLPEENKESKGEEEIKKEKKKPSIYDIALFVPLDIDRVVGGNFEIGSNKQLPSATLNGLGFYEGALMAIDSLRAENIPVRLHVFDSRSEKEPLPQLFKSGKLDTADLILGAVRGDDFKNISSFAKRKKINFVSVTYPNDGGVNDNPYLFIVNSTIQVHCTALQSFAQKKFGSKKITVVYKDNSQGKKNLSYLKGAYQKMDFSRKVPLNTFEWKGEDETEAKSLLKQLDKKKTNVIVLTTLYPDVSLGIIKQLIPYAEEYKISVVGMPTLNGLSELKKEKFEGIDLYYGTVFPYAHLEKYPIMKRMMWNYFSAYHARPSEEAMNGYETMFYFGHLLGEKDDFLKKVNHSSGKLATSFNFQPIYKEKEAKSDEPDYFENTRIYFLHERDGKVEPAN